MDSWPSSQREGPRPQDASVCSTVEIVDLSRRHRETPLKGSLGAMPMGDQHNMDCCRDSSLHLVWSTDRTGLCPERFGAPALTKPRAQGMGGACFVQWAHGKPVTANQWGGQKVERQNGSIHPRQWDGCVAGSWGHGPYSDGTKGPATVQGCYTVNGGYLYGTGGALCAGVLSPESVKAHSIAPRVPCSPTMEKSVSTLPNAPKTGAAEEESGAPAALAEQVKRGSEEGVAELCGASPKLGEHLPGDEGVRSNCFSAAIGCHFERAELAGSETEQTVMAGDARQECWEPTFECDGLSAIVLPQTCSPPAQPGSAMTQPTETDSSLPSVLPPSGSASKGQESAGRGTVRKQSVSDRPAEKKPGSGKKKPKQSGRAGHSAVFSPREPEITLRYANHKVERRDTRADTFVPYIHLEQRKFTVCTVVNSLVEERARLPEGLSPTGSPFSSCTIPTSSCLVLGRLSAEVATRPGPVCCLCHKGANAPDLGDLHGPYRPSGAGPKRQAASTAQGLEEELSNQSDSSCSLQGFGLKPRSLSEACNILRDRDASWAPLAKRPKVSCPAEERPCPSVDDFGSREYWIHEDCGVWSPGVFLVRGKLYGLEEAVRSGQETVCSLCREDGATLGCFFKGCPSKFHYTCSVDADCMLNEENFSLKCPSHKNRPVKGLAQQERW